MFNGIKNLFNLTAGQISERKEIIDMITYSAIGFVAHFFFKHPQERLGIVINTLLVLAALNLRGKKLIPVIILPSLGALLGSYLFHDMTFMILSFVPLLWIGNTILVLAFKWLYLERKINFFLTLFIGATTKYLFLTLAAYVFIVYGLAPDVFMQSMGRIQLITAVFGGIIAFLVTNVKLENKLKK